MMLIIRIQQRKIGRTIDKDSSFSQRAMGEEYRLTGQPF
jgi:hypothetical protein